MTSPDIILGEITNDREPFNSHTNLKDQAQQIQVQSKGSPKGPLMNSRMTGMGMGLVGSLVDSASTMAALGIWHETTGIVLESYRSDTREGVRLWAHKDIVVSSVGMWQSCHRRLQQGNLQ